MIDKTASQYLMEKIENIFIQRTDLHRSSVKKNMLLMQGYLGLSQSVLEEIANQHDLSKYTEAERESYKWLTWMYYCKNNNIDFDFPKNIEVIIAKGRLHHISKNKHHPEAHIDVNTMNEIDIIEMVCDWSAIAQEQNSANKSCKLWALANIDSKWNFKAGTKKLIFATIQELDNRIKAFDRF